MLRYIWFVLSYSDSDTLWLFDLLLTDFEPAASCPTDVHLQMPMLWIILPVVWVRYPMHSVLLVNANAFLRCGLGGLHNAAQCMVSEHGDHC